MQKAVRNNIQELDSFFWLLKLYYIEMKNNAAKGLSLCRILQTLHHENGLSTTFNPHESTMRVFFEKWRAIYLRF